MDVDLQDADIDIENEIQEIREEFDYTTNQQSRENALTQLGRFIYVFTRSTIEMFRGRKIILEYH